MGEQVSQDALALLHLSHIRFQVQKHGDVYELDKDLRNELTRDAARVS